MVSSVHRGIVRVSSTAVLEMEEELHEEEEEVVAAGPPAPYCQAWQSSLNHKSYPRREILLLQQEEVVSRSLLHYLHCPSTTTNRDPNPRCRK